MAPITYELLKEWAETGAIETQKLEFKAVLPEGTNEARLEFLKDVSAMANSDGGTIVYGMSEKAGQASNLRPIEGQSPDAVKRRLGQIAESGVEPRLPTIDFQVVDHPGGGFLLALIIPRSYIGPHQVSSSNAFYIRSASHTTQFSYSQLRDAFTLRSHAEDRIRQWRAARLALIKSGRMPRPLIAGARYVIHILPVAAFAAEMPVSITKFANQGNKLLFGRLSSFATFFNLDGLVASSAFNQTEDAKYVQLFRNGAIETAGFFGLTHDSQKIIPAEFFANELRSALATQLDALISLGISGPVVIATAFLSVRDYRLGVSNYHLPATDRDDLELPEIFSESIYELSSDIDVVARPILDILWQSFGQQFCGMYDPHGLWRGPADY